LNTGEIPAVVLSDEQLGIKTDVSTVVYMTVHPDENELALLAEIVGGSR
jgi:hypothetical protein